MPSILGPRLIWNLASALAVGAIACGADGEGSDGGAAGGNGVGSAPSHARSGAGAANDAGSGGTSAGAVGNAGGAGRSGAAGGSGGTATGGGAAGGAEGGAAGSAAAGGGGAPAGGALAVGGSGGVVPPIVTAVDAERITFDNARGETIRAELFAPAVAQALPAVVVLHGSGGLYRPLGAGESTTNAPCSDEMERQFREWSDILPNAGYVTLFPSSFASRGFCDYNQDAPATFDDVARLTARAFDLFAATQTLCDDPRVLCDRIGLLGFSNGGSITVLGVHERLDDIVELAGLPTTRNAPRVGIAYYPGCGLQGFVTLSENPTRIDEYYFPSVPLWVEHAELDPLLDNCLLRDRQTSAVATSRGIPNPFQLGVSVGADHGFDSTPANPIEQGARDDARARTLSRLRDALFDG